MNFFILDSCLVGSILLLLFDSLEQTEEEPVFFFEDLGALLEEVVLGDAGIVVGPGVLTVLLVGLGCLPAAFEGHEDVTTKININSCESDERWLVDEGDKIVPNAPDDILDQWVAVLPLVLLLQVLEQCHHLAEFLHKL